MRKKTIFISFILLLIIIITSGIAFFAFRDRLGILPANKSWYAVYLNNNQVYFGHITDKDDAYVVLSDAHTLQAVEAPAEQSTSEHFSLTPTTPQQSFKLVQRGSDQSVGTDHSLTINRSAILYWEKLSATAQVVKLLEDEKQ